MIKYLNIDFKNYEILKTISERLNILSWALSGLYGYIGIKFDNIFAILLIATTWGVLQVNSLIFISIAQKYKKDK